MSDESPCVHHRLSRRGLFGAGAGIAASAAMADLLGAAPADAQVQAGPGDPAGVLRFAAVTDTHMNASSPQRSTWLTQVYAAMARRSPDAVLHCGDVTDTGLPGEYDLYAATVPSSLRGLIHYSPGNHETRWDPSAKEVFRAHFGPGPYSFDLGGVHFIGFEPTEVLQEPGHYGTEGLDWLRRDLNALRPGTPAILFQHFPFGNTFYYVDDQPAILAELSRQPALKAIVAGHIHKEDFSRFNGITQVALNAVLNAPVYYWFEQTGDDLAMSRVAVAADGTETETPLLTIPLKGDGPGSDQRPDVVDLGKVAAAALPVTVQVDPARAVTVEARQYPQAVFGGTGTGAWHPLTQNGRRWTGTVDVTGVAPGRQSLEVRVKGSDGSWWQETPTYAVPGSATDPAVRWQAQLSGSVQGGVTVIDADRGLVAVATTTGELVAFNSAGDRMWHGKTGPAYRRPAIDASGRSLYVPSADHHLYAVDATSGRVQWSYDAGAPVLSVPTVVTVDGAERIVFSAGERLLAVDTAGRPLWTLERGFSSGQAASDGDAVYTAAADGYARAHDIRTGAQRWATQMVTGDAHHIALYSGWDTVTALRAGTVIVATVSQATALSAATGTQTWRLSGSTMYAPALTFDDGTALLTTENGVLTLVDLATGAVRWTINLALRVFNAGVVVEDGIAWVITVDGKTIGVRLADGTRTGWLQHSLVYNFGRPEVVRGTLVVGDQNGVVHGLRLPTT